MAFYLEEKAHSPTFVYDRSYYRRGELIIWPAIDIGGRMSHIQNGKLTDEILKPHILI